MYLLFFDAGLGNSLFKLYDYLHAKFKSREYAVSLWSARSEDKTEYLPPKSA